MAQNCKVKLLEHGALGVVGEDNPTRIRNVYSSVASGRAVYVNSDNKIGAPISSRQSVVRLQLRGGSLLRCIADSKRLDAMTRG